MSTKITVDFAQFRAVLFTTGSKRFLWVEPLPGKADMPQNSVSEFWAQAARHFEVRPVKAEPLEVSQAGAVAEVRYDLSGNNTFCFDLSQAEIKGHHPLCSLAYEAGYPSLRACLNDCNWWNLTVAQVAANLSEASEKENAAPPDTRKWRIVSEYLGNDSEPYTTAQLFDYADACNAEHADDPGWGTPFQLVDGGDKILDTSHPHGNEGHIAAVPFE